MDINVLITVLGSVIVAVAGFIIEKERERNAKLHQRKEELYRNLLYALKGFFQGNQDRDLKQQCVDEMRLTRLYANDASIRALNRFVDMMQMNEQEYELTTGQNFQKDVHRLLGEFIKAMREDLGIITDLSAEELGRTEKLI